MPRRQMPQNTCPGSMPEQHKMQKPCPSDMPEQNRMARPCPADMPMQDMGQQPCPGSMPEQHKMQKPCPSDMPEQNRMARPCPSMPVGCPDRPDPLAGMPVGMAYVPWQFFRETFEPDKALQCGTIFPELSKPFLGKGGCTK